MRLSTTAKIFIFVCTVLLGLITLSNAIPINENGAALQYINIPPIYNGTLAVPGSPSNDLAARQGDWVLDLYWQSSNGDYVPMPICTTNYGNHGMCSVGYFTSTDMNSATLWMWDNTCSQLGYYESLSYSTLENGVFLHSSLPETLVLHFSGGFQNGADIRQNLVYWWPGPPNYSDWWPAANPTFQHFRVTHVDHEFFSWVMPFACH